MPDPLFGADGDVVAGGGEVASAVAVGAPLKVAAVAEVTELTMVEARVGLENGVEAGPGAALEPSRS